VGVSPPAAVETCEKGIDLVVISQVSKADVNSYGGYPSPLSCDSFRKYGFVNSLSPDVQSGHDPFYFIVSLKAL
jgi:hypothetical protein